MTLPQKILDISKYLKFYEYYGSIIQTHPKDFNCDQALSQQPQLPGLSSSRQGLMHRRWWQSCKPGDLEEFAWSNGWKWKDLIDIVEETLILWYSMILEFLSVPATTAGLNTPQQLLGLNSEFFMSENVVMTKSGQERSELRICYLCQMSWARLGNLADIPDYGSLWLIRVNPGSTIYDDPKILDVSPISFMSWPSGAPKLSHPNTSVHTVHRLVQVRLCARSRSSSSCPSSHNLLPASTDIFTSIFAADTCTEPA